MNKPLTKVCGLAKQAFAPLGITVTGCHYWMPQPPQTLQKKKKGICLCFDATTHNPHLFGKEYQNQYRIKLLDLCYQVAWQKMNQLFPEHEILLDIYVKPAKPFVCQESPFESPAREPKLAKGLVDVTKDNEVYFVELETLVSSGEIEKDSTIDRYCQRYNLKHVLKHGRHFISPDSSTVEAFEAIAETEKVKSVLEVGAGVGISGQAVQKMGIPYFKFLDSSPKVCKYLKNNYPFPVIEGNVLYLDLYRDYDGDVILIGLPYELNPYFLSKKGWQLPCSYWTAVWQSGCTAFFEFEHDWLMGKAHFHDWPWWKPHQTVPFYFPAVLEMALEWQTCIIAATNRDRLAKIEEKLSQRGFEKTKYKYLTI